MKAYKAWDNASIESYSTIVFAENSREALCKSLGLDYYIKDGLRAEMDKQ